MDPAQQYPAVLEALRRAQGQTPSSAGIPGGAPVANSPMPSNPIAQQGMAPSSPAPSAPNPAGPFATSGASKALNNALPGEATMILKTLDRTLNRLTPKTPFGG